MPLGSCKPARIRNPCRARCGTRAYQPRWIFTLRSCQRHSGALLRSYPSSSTSLSQNLSHSLSHYWSNKRVLEVMKNAERLNRINQMSTADYIVRNDEVVGSIPTSSTKISRLQPSPVAKSILTDASCPSVFLHSALSCKLKFANPEVQ
jgi:hypothetical protein